MAIPVLELQELCCTRGGSTLFENLSLSIPSGRLLRVTGANGAGKSSLLRVICGLLPPTRGQVLWRGAGIRERRERFHRALVYQGHTAALKEDLSAAENLRASARLAGLDPSAPAIGSALQSTGLHGHERVPVRELSQGQRRRAVLARLVLSSDAPLWVLDEPFNALDTSASTWLQQLIARQVASNGVVVLSNHDRGIVWPAEMPQLEIAL